MKIRPAPCKFCPYRKDVPSGVWHKSEYEKLPEYDRPTCEQPSALFMCHEKTGSICCGWSQCHRWELLSLRLASYKERFEIPTITTGIFESGRKALEHGMRLIKRPNAKARKAMSYVTLIHNKRNPSP